MAKKRPKTRLPNPISYFFAAGLARLAAPLAGVRWDTRAIRALKPPYLFVCNHTSFLDFIAVAGGMFPRRISFVVAAYFYKSRWVSALLNHFGCIPKLQFQADVASIRAMREAIQQGGIVGIFPGGQVTAQGTEGYVSPSIARLAQFLRVPVVLGHMEGAYMKAPKWGRLRLGPARFTATLLLTAEQVRESSQEQIWAALRQGLAYNDPRWAQETGARYRRPGLCRGLEEVLYRCPRCGAYFCMEARGRLLGCRACGFQVRMRPDGALEWPGGCLRIDQWYDLQLQDLLAAARQPDFCLEAPAVLRRDEGDGKGLTRLGEGTITLTREALIYQGTEYGRPQRISFDMNLVETVSCSVKHRHFEVPGGGRFHSFGPPLPGQAVQWAAAVDALRLIREEIQHSN